MMSDALPVINQCFIQKLFVPQTHNKLGNNSFSASTVEWNDFPPGLQRPGLSISSLDNAIYLATEGHSDCIEFIDTVQIRSSVYAHHQHYQLLRQEIYLLLCLLFSFTAPVLSLPNIMLLTVVGKVKTKVRECVASEQLSHIN